MMKSETVSICGISYELGSLHRIEDSLVSGDSEKSLNSLAEKGLQSYSQFDGSIVSVIQHSATNSILAAGITADVVECVLVVTESFAGIVNSPSLASNFREVRNAVFDILAETGITNVPFFCSTFGGSSNLLQAIFLANHMIKASQYSNLLLVCIDRVPAEHTRIMEAAVALTGDGVATCIITREPKFTSPVYSIEHVGISPYLTAGHQGDWNRLVLEMYRATKNAAADCYEQIGLQPSDFDWLIQANYNELSSQVFSRLLGFHSDRTFTHNLSRIGHIPSCDALINLLDLSTSINLIPSSRLLIFLNGPISCGTIALLVQPHTDTDSGSTFKAMT